MQMDLLGCKSVRVLGVLAVVNRLVALAMSPKQDEDDGSLGQTPQGRLANRHRSRTLATLNRALETNLERNVTVEPPADPRRSGRNETEAPHPFDSLP